MPISYPSIMFKLACFAWFHPVHSCHPAFMPFYFGGGWSSRSSTVRFSTEYWPFERWRASDRLRCPHPCPLKSAVPAEFVLAKAQFGTMGTISLISNLTSNIIIGKISQKPCVRWRCRQKMVRVGACRSHHEYRAAPLRRCCDAWAQLDSCAGRRWWLWYF